MLYVRLKVAHVKVHGKGGGGERECGIWHRLPKDYDWKFQNVLPRVCFLKCSRFFRQKQDGL